MESFARNTEIVATVGPNSANGPSLARFYEAGAKVFRLNSSHNTLDWHRNTIRLIREFAPDGLILLDLPGSKIRLDRMLEDVLVSEGDQVVLKSIGESNLALKRIRVTHSAVETLVEPGSIVLADGGSLELRVKKIDGKDVHLVCSGPGRLGSKKGLHIPGNVRKASRLAERDQTILELALEEGVDFVGLSFVDFSSQVDALREVVGDRVGILSKVETAQGVENMTGIIAKSDAIMIDRGDLSLETPMEDQAFLQRMIVKKANELEVPVVVATEFLMSMIDRSVPTKAEVSDISHAVWDGASAVMLSEETAIGLFPEKAISVMATVASAAEKKKSCFQDISTPMKISQWSRDPTYSPTSNRNLETPTTHTTA